MYLSIDLSEYKKIKLGLFSEAQLFSYESDGGNSDLLVHIDTFLQQQNMKSEDVLGIAIVQGEGGFTSTRISQVVAHAFVYVHNIGMIGVSAEDLQNSLDVIEAITDAKPGEFKDVVYSGAPNIVKSKKNALGLSVGG